MRGCVGIVGVKRSVTAPLMLLVPTQPLPLLLLQLLLLLARLLLLLLLLLPLC